MNSAKFDRDQIEQAVALVMREPGDVIELRMPISKQRTDSGYFDDSKKLVDAAIKASGMVPGVYVTLNPVNPALLARAANRVQTAAKVTTADKDIVRRRWLLLDFDAIRPAGISSTDKEHEAALNCAMNARDDLREEGWPDPVLADSGNGAHLLYPIDLPNDDESADLIRRVLAGAAERFDRPDVVIDRGVFNASRISKLYGTLARKGDGIPERPHRLGRIA